MKIDQKYEIIRKELTQLHELNKELGKRKIVIGLSGGVDSAVVAALVADIIGKERLFAVNMPSKHSSDKTKSLSKQIANNLGIEYNVIEIQDMIDIMWKDVCESIACIFSERRLRVEEGNVTARIRNSVLQTFANLIDGVVICTINKLEYLRFLYEKNEFYSI